MIAQLVFRGPSAVPRVPRGFYRVYLKVPLHCAVSLRAVKGRGVLYLDPPSASAKYLLILDCHLCEPAKQAAGLTVLAFSRRLFVPHYVSSPRPSTHVTCLPTSAQRLLFGTPALSQERPAVIYSIESVASRRFGNDSARDRSYRRFLP